MRYRLTALGTAETVVTAKRRYQAQCKGKLAAISIPSAEMMRLWNECDGNLEVVLGPMRMALADAGYTDLFILPAQTALVELEKECDVDPTSTEDILEHRTNQLKALVRAAKDLLAKQTTTSSRDLAISAYTLSSLIAQTEVELWAK